MRISHALLAAACSTLVVVACSKTDKPAPAPDASSAAATPAAPVEAPKPPTPEDLDPAQLQASMKCPGSTFKAACEILDQFKKGEAWDMTTIRGADARYFGKGVEAGADGAVERYYFLIVKRVPLNEVSAADLPAKLTFLPLDTTREVEIAQAPKLLRLLEKDDAVNRTIMTAKYVLDYAPSRWDGASATKGMSTFAQTGSGAYVRMTEKRRLVFVQPSLTRPGGQPGEGVYAILYPLSW